MLDHLWAGMILAGILWAAFHGRLSDVTLGMLDGAADAVSLGGRGSRSRRRRRRRGGKKRMPARYRKMPVWDRSDVSEWMERR